MKPTIREQLTNVLEEVRAEDGMFIAVYIEPNGTDAFVAAFGESDPLVQGVALVAIKAGILKPKETNDNKTTSGEGS